MVTIGAVNERNDRSGINERAGHETPCARARGRCRTGFP
jgi:hypothetical protein